MRRPARAAAAGLSESLSRLVQHKALRAAAAWEGPLRRLGLSINLLPDELAHDSYVDWLLDEVAAKGNIATAEAAGKKTVFSIFDPDIQVPYTIQSMVSVQHSLGRTMSAEVSR